MVFESVSGEIEKDTFFFFLSLLSLIFTIVHQKRHAKNVKMGGSWLAGLVEHVTLDLGVMSLSPTFGVEVT